MAENSLHVFGEVGIEGGSLSSFLFVCFGQRDAVGNVAARGLGGMKDSHRVLSIFDDDLGARADARHKRGKVARRPPRRIKPRSTAAGSFGSSTIRSGNNVC